MGLFSRSTPKPPFGSTFLASGPNALNKWSLRRLQAEIRRIKEARKIRRNGNEAVNKYSKALTEFQNKYVNMDSRVTTRSGRGNMMIGGGDVALVPYNPDAKGDFSGAASMKFNIGRYPRQSGWGNTALRVNSINALAGAAYYDPGDGPIAGMSANTIDAAFAQAQYMYDQVSNYQPEESSGMQDRRFAQYQPDGRLPVYRGRYQPDPWEGWATGEGLGAGGLSNPVSFSRGRNNQDTQQPLALQDREQFEADFGAILQAREAYDAEMEPLRRYQQLSGSGLGYLDTADNYFLSRLENALALKRSELSQFQSQVNIPKQVDRGSIENREQRANAGVTPKGVGSPNMPGPLETTTTQLEGVI